MRWKFLCLLAMLAPLPAAAGERPDEDAARAWTAFATRMQVQGTPRERALISQVYKELPARSPGRAEALRTIREAAEAAPSDPIVQWVWASSPIEVTDCSAQSPCGDRAWAAARLMPDNAAAWAPVLVEALGTADPDDELAALARMAQASYYAEPFAEVFGAWRELLRQHPLPAAYYAQFEANPDGRVPSRAERDATSAMAFTAALLSPSHGVHALCRSERGHAEPVRAHCLRVARLMQDAPTVFQRMMGGGLQREAGGGEPKNFQRQALWWISTLVALERDGRELLQYFDDLESTGSEIRAMELAMQRAGKPLSPPVDWVWVSPYAGTAAGAAEKAAAEARAEAGEDADVATAPARPGTP